MTVAELIAMLQQLPDDVQQASVSRLITHPGHVAPIRGMEVRRTKIVRLDYAGERICPPERQTQIILR